MTNPAHIAETALLLLAAYLLGCVLGYAIRRILHAGRGTRQVPASLPTMAPVSPPPEPRRTLSPAARLAARVEDITPPINSGASSKLADPKPATLALARENRPDNLKQIKGIGPKIEASLYATGIFHLDQIAGWSPRNVEWVDAQLAFKGRIRRERWVEQAAELTKADA